MSDTTKPTNPKDAAAVTRIPLWLCSPIAKAHWALAQFAGMLKYGAWNWRVSGVRSSVYLSAMQRHLDAYLSGEEVDPIDGTHHLGNIMASAAIILDAKAAGKLTDDRPPSVDIRGAYGQLEALAARLREQYADREPRHCTIEDTQPPHERAPFVIPIDIQFSVNGETTRADIAERVREVLQDMALQAGIDDAPPTEPRVMLAAPAALDAEPDPFPPLESPDLDELDAAAAAVAPPIWSGAV